VGWVFFRAASATDAVQLLSAMAGLQDFAIPGSWLNVMPGILSNWPGVRVDHQMPGLTDQLFVLLLAVAAVAMPNTQELISRVRFTPAVAWATGGLAALCMLSLNRVSEFLYFQF
jgi:alginate O-acetyltransferase complex protein AlgI